ncbi:MAG: HutD-family protein, partial [Clostridium sp.]
TIVAICIHPLNTAVKCEVDMESYNISKGDLLYIDVIDSTTLPRIKFINSNENSAKIISAIIFKKN